MHFKKFEYLREFEFKFEKALSPYSGAQDGCFDEITEGRKSRDSVPLIIAMHISRKGVRIFAVC
jgi:hypothetical protein